MAGKKQTPTKRPSILTRFRKNIFRGLERDAISKGRSISPKSTAAAKAKKGAP
jgi:hypothetical protein